MPDMSSDDPSDWVINVGDPDTYGWDIGAILHGAGTSSVTPQRMPFGYDLNNYPNPFSSSTTINYRIEKQGKVQINVYTVTGSLLKTLVSFSIL